MLRLCLLVSAASALNVTVLGGTGFVGSRVCHALATSSSSVEVVSVSRTGEVPEDNEGEVDYESDTKTGGGVQTTYIFVAPP